VEDKTRGGEEDAMPGQDGLDEFGKPAPILVDLDECEFKYSTPLVGEDTTGDSTDGKPGYAEDDQPKPE
jgi:hypothetical protein